MSKVKEVTRVKIGKYSVPDIRLFPTIYEAIKDLYENYVFDEAKDEDAVAVLLGHKSANSGAFLSKLADLRLYGLLEPRSIQVTKLAETLTHGTEEGKQEAINEAILNVPLWTELHSKFGVEVPESNFWLQLKRITGVSSLEAQKQADLVRKAYLDDMSHYKAKKEDEKMSDRETGGKIDTTTAITTSVERQANIVQNLIKEGAYDIAKNFIDFIKKKGETEVPKEEMSEEGG